MLNSCFNSYLFHSSSKSYIADQRTFHCEQIGYHFSVWMHIALLESYTLLDSSHPLNCICSALRVPHISDTRENKNNQTEVPSTHTIINHAHTRLIKTEFAVKERAGCAWSLKMEWSCGKNSKLNIKSKPLHSAPQKCMCDFRQKSNRAAEKEGEQIGVSELLLFSLLHRRKNTGRL